MIKGRDKKLRDISKNLSERTFSYAIGLSLGHNVEKSPGDRSEASIENTSPNRNFSGADNDDEDAGYKKHKSTSLSPSMSDLSHMAGENIIRAIMEKKRPSSELYKSHIPLPHRKSRLHKKPDTEVNPMHAGPVVSTTSPDSRPIPATRRNAVTSISLKVNFEDDNAHKSYDSPIAAKGISPYRTNRTIIKKLKSKLAYDLDDDESFNYEVFDGNIKEASRADIISLRSCMTVILAGFALISIALLSCQISFIYSADTNSLSFYRDILGNQILSIPSLAQACDGVSHWSDEIGNKAYLSLKSTSNMIMTSMENDYKYASAAFIHYKELVIQSDMIQHPMEVIFDAVMYEYITVAHHHVQLYATYITSLMPGNTLESLQYVKDISLLLRSRVMDELVSIRDYGMYTLTRACDHAKTIGYNVASTLTSISLSIHGEYDRLLPILYKEYNNLNDNVHQYMSNGLEYSQRLYDELIMYIDDHDDVDEYYHDIVNQLTATVMNIEWRQAYVEKRLSSYINLVHSSSDRLDHQSYEVIADQHAGVITTAVDVGVDISAIEYDDQVQPMVLEQELHVEYADDNLTVVDINEVVIVVDDSNEIISTVIVDETIVLVVEDMIIPAVEDVDIPADVVFNPVVLAHESEAVVEDTITYDVDQIIADDATNSQHENIVAYVNTDDAGMITEFLEVSHDEIIDDVISSPEVIDTGSKLNIDEELVVMTASVDSADHVMNIEDSQLIADSDIIIHVVVNDEVVIDQTASVEDHIPIDTSNLVISSSLISFIAIIVSAVVGAAAIMLLVSHYDSNTLSADDIIIDQNHDGASLLDSKSSRSNNNDSYFDIMNMVDGDNAIPQSVPRHRSKGASRRRLIENLETPLRRSHRIRRASRSFE